jgi:WD40 repeat protein
MAVKLCHLLVEYAMCNSINSRCLALLTVVFLSAGCSAYSRKSSRVEYIAFSPNGTWLVAAGGIWLESGNLKVWKCSGWILHADWTEGISGQIQSGSFASEDVFVSIGGKRHITDQRMYGGNELRFWNILEKRETEIIDLENARGFANQIDYLPDKNMLVTNQWVKFGTAACYSVPNPQKETEFGTDLKFTVHLRFSPDGKKILCCNGLALCLFEVSTGKLIAQRKVDDCDHNSHILSAAFSPSGDMIAVGLQDPNKVYVIPSDLGATWLTCDSEFDPKSVSFTPDNAMIGATNRGAIEVISIKNKTIVHRFENTRAEPSRWCFSPDGSMIAIANAWHIRVLDIKTGKVLAELGL